MAAGFQVLDFFHLDHPRPLSFRDIVSHNDLQGDFVAFHHVTAVLRKI